MADQNRHAALKLVAIYGLAGGAWMFLSDGLSKAWGVDTTSLLSHDSWKHGVFLGGTGLLLFLLLNHHFRKSDRRETLLRETEDALRASEAQSRAVLDNAADGIIAADAAGIINLFNPAAAAIFDYDPDEILGQNIKILIPRPYLREHESYRPNPTPPPEAREEIIRIGREVVGRRKNGESFPVELAVSEVSQGRQQLFIAVVRDITHRKRAENELTQSREQLRSLAARLQTIREGERTRISREIHDELGQSLTGVKMDLSWISARLPKDMPQLHDRSKSMFELIDSTIQSVRKIATDLRPGILDNLGLVAALEWQAGEFQSRTGIQCHTEADAGFPDLDPAYGTALFRIFQETLTNVTRHAQATRVDVRLKQTDSHVLLQITDNGRGITSEELTGSKSLGLLGMRERAAMLGGRVEIKPGAKSGTTVTITLPKVHAPTLAHES